jgi:hypothetical protein
MKGAYNVSIRKNATLPPTLRRRQHLVHSSIQVVLVVVSEPSIVCSKPAGVAVHVFLETLLFIVYPMDVSLWQTSVAVFSILGRFERFGRSFPTVLVVT